MGEKVASGAMSRENTRRFIAEAEQLVKRMRDQSASHVAAVLSSGPTPTVDGQSVALASRFAPLPLIERVGDLFAEPADHLAHCVSVDCKLGAGIAKTFVERFGRASFRNRIASTLPVVGCVVVLGTESGKTVYNLVTKEKYWQKPTLPALIETLIAMRSHAQSNAVRRIAMPRIGCGLDQLEWRAVREAIEYVFLHSGVQIIVVELAATPATSATTAPPTLLRSTRVSDLTRTIDELPPASSAAKRARTGDLAAPERKE